MTWKELENEIAKMSDEQSNAKVCFRSDREQEVWDLDLYIAKTLIKDYGTCGDIESGMPYLQF